MTESKPTAPARIAPAGLMFLAITSVGWGFNWPVTKYLLSELPPLTLRGSTGVIGAVLLAVLALARSQSLKVERHLWPRLMLAALLNVTGWMVLMGLALLWLAGQRNRADRLHHAGMGLAFGRAGARRAADHFANGGAGAGVRRIGRHHGRQRF
jgi:drug/metabolite transporter (DMT)-like permease